MTKRTALLRRLVDLDANVLYQEPPADNEPTFQYIPGRIDVLLSAPHGAVHMRKGKPKEEEEYTSGLACLVAELTDAHALYAHRRSNTDPNWYRGIPYKKSLKRIIAKAKINFVFDLHGVAEKRDFGIALGTMRGSSCPDHRDEIIHTLGNFGFKPKEHLLKRLDVDNRFTARGKRGQETITRYVWEKLHVQVAQLELHPFLTVVERRPDATLKHPLRGEPQEIENLIHTLTALVMMVTNSSNGGRK